MTDQITSGICAWPVALATGQSVKGKILVRRGQQLFIIELFHQPTLMHNFLYSLTTYLLHYYTRHVSSINMPIFRRKNCIHTASGIFALN